MKNDTYSIDLKATSTYSLEGTDLILRSILREVAIGRYMDIGANHPYEINNTFLLYQLGWQGLALDANDKFKIEWSKYRPNDQFLQAVVSDTEKEVIFTLFPDDTMGSMDQATINRYESRFEKDLLKKQIFKSTTVFNIWKTYIDDEVHLLSIDIEGEELNALKGTNLHVFRPGIIAVEIKNVSLYSPLSNDLIYFLTNHGYRLVAKTPLDAIFIDPNKDYFQWIPSTLVTT